VFASVDDDFSPENFARSDDDANEHGEDNGRENEKKVEPPKRFKSTAWKFELVEWVKAFVCAYVIVLLLKTFVFALVLVDGESMEPTLDNNDHLYVSKIMYTPKRGDIVVFETDYNRNKPYVKRIIGVGGDKIYIDFKSGLVYLNGTALDEPYIKDLTHMSEHYTSRMQMLGEYSADKPINVPEDDVFVLGDNRPNSLDSREFGPFPAKDVIGRAVFRLWPNFGSLN
jgi:signal peptidase I